MENNQEQPQGIIDPTNSSEKSPCKVYFEWKSKNKAFVYYDKVKKENVSAAMPFTFIPLYKCITLKGYNHKKTKNYISNEVKDIQTDVFVVKSYQPPVKQAKTEYKGLYADIREVMDDKIKYTISLYAAVKNKKSGQMTLVNMQLNGAALFHWFDFEEKTKIWGSQITVKETTSETSGDVDFNAPVYSVSPLSKEDNIAAGKLQVEISNYLNGYFAKNAAAASDQNLTQDQGTKEKFYQTKEDHENKGSGDKPKHENTSSATSWLDEPDENAPF